MRSAWRVIPTLTVLARCGARPCQLWPATALTVPAVSSGLSRFQLPKIER